MSSEREIIQIRLAGASGDAERAEGITDALHNVPRLSRETQTCGWTVAGVREMFLAPLVERSPDLVGLERPLDEIA